MNVLELQDRSVIAIMEAPMIDQHHAKVVTLQSSAVVLAALITTMGAIGAACIQTGWIGRPALTTAATAPTATIASRTTPPTAQVSFLGTIEPAERTFANSPLSRSTVDSMHTAINTSAYMPVENVRSTTQPLASPWLALSNQAAGDKRAEPPKPSKGFGWDSITRLFQGRN
jgi:hypothetical protein